jgi:hypothetical protein
MGREIRIENDVEELQSAPQASHPAPDLRRFQQGLRRVAPNGPVERLIALDGNLGFSDDLTAESVKALSTFAWPSKKARPPLAWRRALPAAKPGRAVTSLQKPLPR